MKLTFRLRTSKSILTSMMTVWIFEFTSDKFDLMTIYTRGNYAHKWI
jgi:hypothetical protein